MDPDLGRTEIGVRAVGDGLQERRPLHAVLGVEVDDVQAPRAAAGGGGIQYRLVRRQVREPQERRDLVVRQVRRRRRRPGGRRRRGSRSSCARGRGGGDVVPAVHAAGERAAKVVREAVGRVAPRVGGGQDLGRRAPGAVDVAPVEEAGAREHEPSRRGGSGAGGGVLLLMLRARRGVAVVAGCAEHGGGVRARWAQERMARAG